MKKLKTHFEQVPIQSVVRLLQKEESNCLPEKQNGAGRPHRNESKARVKQKQLKVGWRRMEKMEKDDVKNQSSTRWQTLCEQAAKEQNPERLMALVRDIIKEFDERHKEQTKDGAA